MSIILVVSVHPDDETLGCGGSLLKHIKSDDHVHCLYVTRGNEHQSAVISTLDAKYLFAKSYSLDIPELTLDDISLNEIIPKITEVINKVKPEILYIPNRSDANSDHRRVFEALIACTKTFRFQFIRKILMYEVISETEFAPALNENAFIPNVFIDISEFFEKKLEIMGCFESELMAANLPRSYNAIKALCAYRGSRIGVDFAEAFMLLFERS